MKWCVEAIKNPALLREIYIILEQREADRRTKTIEDHQPYTAKTAQLSINRLKNRYYDIYPYDCNRLVLPNPIQGNDYINASWIVEPSFRLPAQFQHQIPNFHPPQPQTWIATQGPLRQTCYEFLSLCLVPNLTERPKVIIQLAACLESGREKTADYIPSKVGESIEFQAHSSVQIPSKPTATTGLEKYRWSLLTDPLENSIHGHIRVTLQKCEMGPNQSSDHSNNSSTPSNFYIKNTLLVEIINRQTDSSNLQSNSNQSISSTIVIHYQCIGWKDRGVPDSVELILELITSAKADSIMNMPSNQTTGSSNTTVTSSKSNSEQTDKLLPILVHCSAGVGRTGTLIAIASFITQLDQLASLCPLDLKAQALSSLLPPLPFGHDGRLPSLPASLDLDLVGHTVDFLREQRVSMVQTEGQIGFVYKSVAHLLDSLL